MGEGGAMLDGDFAVTTKQTKAGARCWLLIFLESSVLVPLSISPDTEWESGVMTKAHAEDVCGGVGVSPTGRKERRIIHQGVIHFSILHL